MWSTQSSSSVLWLLVGKCDKLTIFVRNYVTLIPVSVAVSSNGWKEEVLSEFEIWPSVDWDNDAETIDNETKLYGEA